MNEKRVFLIVLDSLGIGAMPDAGEYGDEGSNTLEAALSLGGNLPNLQKLGLFHIEGVCCRPSSPSPEGAFARMREISRGKDSTIGHWEIACLPSSSPLPTYPNGFPAAVLKAFSERTGRGVLCNRPYSGTDVIREPYICSDTRLYWHICLCHQRHTPCFGEALRLVRRLCGGVRNSHWRDVYKRQTWHLPASNARVL